MRGYRFTCVTLLLCSAAWPGFAQNAMPPGPQSDEGAIIVTATRRDARVLEVPYNISALGADSLREAGIQNVADLRNATPGLTASDYGARGNNVNSGFIIRGINTEGADGAAGWIPNLRDANVSTYIDEVPLFANLKLTDVNRVEVLRGPQGTLFGAGSVGGTVRVIHNRPDFKSIGGEMIAAISGTDSAGDPNYNIQAVLNLPLRDNLALRVSGGYDKTAGVIDALQAVKFDSSGVPVLSDPSDFVNSGFVTERVNDVDKSDVWFARVALRWQPIAAIDLEAAYQHQEISADGFTAQTPGLRNQSLRRVPLEKLDSTIDVASLTATGDLGFATITSATSYSEITTKDITDYSGIAQTFALYYAFYPRIATPGPDDINQKDFSQEIRLVSNKGDDKWDYIIGGYYQNRRGKYFNAFDLPGFTAWANTPGSAAAVEDYLGVPTGTYGTATNFITDYFGGIKPEDLPGPDRVYDFQRRLQRDDYAIFGELTFHPTEKWQITAGARVFWQKNRQRLFSALYLPVFISDTDNKTDLNDQIFKVNTSYEIRPGLLTYFTFAQGFRSGGANAIRPCQTPTQKNCDNPALGVYDPDTADNYEVGVKGSFFDRKLSGTLALFRIDWDKIQVERGSFDGNPIVVNGKTARSQGLELELRGQPAPWLTLSGGYSYTDAKLTASFVSGGAGGFVGNKDDKLPGISEHQVNAAVDVNYPLNEKLTGLFHIDGSWRSEFGTQISTTARNYVLLPGYELLNLSAGVQLGDHYQLQLFVNNLTDSEAISAAARGGRSTTPEVLAFNALDFIARPRTVGLRFTYRRW